MKILSRPKGNAEEYGRWSVNPYKGCGGLCEYCYLKKGVWKSELGGSVPVLKKGTDRYATDMVTEGYVEGGHAAWFFARDEISHHRDEIIRDGGLFMTFTSDPCLPETRWTFFAIVSSCVLMRVPVILLSKRADFVDSDDYQKNLLPYMAFGADRYIAFGWTLTGHDELEPQASPNADRIKAMRSVGNDGFKTWASIEPAIDFSSSLNMILQALDAGCQHFKIGLLTNNTRVVRKDFSFGEYQFKAYDRDACVTFIHDVMRATKGNSTVYWKQSFRDFLGEEDFAHATVGYKNIVDKDWSMFNKED